jgi:hypothetical protein
MHMAAGLGGEEAWKWIRDMETKGICMMHIRVSKKRRMIWNHIYLNISQSKGDFFSG